MIDPEVILILHEQQNQQPIDSFLTLKKRILGLANDEEALQKLLAKDFAVLSSQTGGTIQTISGERVVLKEYLMGIVHKNNAKKIYTLDNKYIITECDDISVDYRSSISYIMKDTLPVAKKIGKYGKKIMLEFPIDESSWYMMRKMEPLCTKEFYQELIKNYLIVGVCSCKWGKSDLARDLIHTLA